MMNRRKKTTNVLRALSPINVSSTNFSREVAEYKAAIDELSRLKGQKEMLFGRMKVFMRTYMADKPLEGTELATLTSKIMVFNKPEKKAFSKEAKQLALYVQRRLNYSANHQGLSPFDDPILVRIMTKAIGDDYRSFIEEVAEVLEYENREATLDEKETEKARTEFRDIAREYDEVTSLIAAQEIKVSQMKEYVSYVKDIASIAAIGKRRKNDDE